MSAANLPVARYNSGFIPLRDTAEPGSAAVCYGRARWRLHPLLVEPNSRTPLFPARAIAASVALLSGAAATPVMAVGITVERMERWCQGSVTQKIACDFYFVGALEMIDAAKDVDKAFPQLCFPPGGLSANDAREIFLNWAGNYPVHRQDEVAVGLQLALAEALPCAR